MALAVEGLSVAFRTPSGLVTAVDDVAWSVGPGQTLAVVGESGSGKSVAALALLGLAPLSRGDHVSGTIRVGDDTFDASDERTLRPLRGRPLGMVFQDPLTSLNPVVSVGRQVAEVLRTHASLGRAPAWRRAVELLGEMGIPNPGQRAREYPHQLSGGTRQRAMIALALAAEPTVLIADEPTTGLDVTVQAQVLELLARIQSDRRTAIVLVSHDLGVVAGQADLVVVMYAGRVVEAGTVDVLFDTPRHAYTLGLLSGSARLDQPRPRRLRPIPGQPPSLVALPGGCSFHPRCGLATTPCRTSRPELAATAGDDGHLVACHRSDEVARAAAAMLSGPPT
ncbi:MAG: ABC transporter ATP-binding protein [Acidimicrobiales bacterium]